MREVLGAKDLWLRHMRHICVPIYVSIRQHTSAYVSIRDERQRQASSSGTHTGQVCVSVSTLFRYASLSVYAIQVHIKAAAATQAKRQIYRVICGHIYSRMRTHT